MNLEETLTRLAYDQETGVFSWTAGRRKGHVAGCIDANGYRVIRLAGKNYKAHRLAWYITYGVWPEDLDHINTRRDDNWITNLREAKGMNQQNRRYGTGTSKYLGVCWAKDTKKWQAQIKFHGKVTYLGQFLTEEEASAAYVDAKRRLHEFNTL